MIAICAAHLWPRDHLEAYDWCQKKKIFNNIQHVGFECQRHCIRLKNFEIFNMLEGLPTMSRDKLRIVDLIHA